MRKLLPLLGLLWLLAPRAEAQVIGCPLASTAIPGCVRVDGTSVTINAQGVIAAPTGGSGNVSGPANSVVNSIPQWNNTAGTSLKAGLTVGTSGASTVVQTTAGGLLNPVILPIATAGALGAVKVDGTSITINTGVISAAVSSVTGTAGQITVTPSGTVFAVSLPATITANVNFTGTTLFTGSPLATVALTGNAGNLTGTLLGAQLGSFSGDVTSVGGTYVLNLPAQPGLVAGTYPCATVTVTTKGITTAVSSPGPTCTGGGGLTGLWQVSSGQFYQVSSGAFYRVQ